MFLTPEEIVALTRRKRRPAQGIALRCLGIEHRVRPDGSVAVLRAHVERLLGGKAIPDGTLRKTEPDFNALTRSH